MVPYGQRKVKIKLDEITFGPKTREVDELVSFTFAGDLNAKGYRRVSNAYCRVARIDRDDWLDVMATEINCCVADFYNKDGSGVSDSWKDHYVRVYSKDVLVVHPEILYRIRAY